MYSMFPQFATILPFSVPLSFYPFSFFLFYHHSYTLFLFHAVKRRLIFMLPSPSSVCSGVQLYLPRICLVPGEHGWGLLRAAAESFQRRRRGQLLPIRHQVFPVFVLLSIFLCTRGLGITNLKGEVCRFRFLFAENKRKLPFSFFCKSVFRLRNSGNVETWACRHQTEN
jgi:hypothetical protein